MKKRLYLIFIAAFALALLSIMFTSCAPVSANDNYVIGVTLDTDNMTVAVSETFTYINDTKGKLDHLLFHLYPNAFNENAPCVVPEDKMEEAYYSGSSYGGIDILSVIDGKGNSLEYFEDGQSLKVDIDIHKGGSAVINIEGEITLPAINHRFGYGEHTINLANFYPQLAVWENGAFRMDDYTSIGDPFYSEIADYEVSITADKDYLIASSGDIISESTVDSNTTTILKSENVRDFGAVLSDEFQLAMGEAGDVNVKYYYFSDSEPSISLNAACSAIVVFNDIIGEYPYSSYTVAETDFVYGGMEYPKLSYISSDLGSSREKVIVHETAHQWWSCIVGSDSVNAAWMDEGLTEFSVALYYREAGQADTMNSLLTAAYSSLASYNAAIAVMPAETGVSMRRCLVDYASDSDYYVTAYVKGMLMFDTVYQFIGRDSFVECMKSYYEENKYTNASEADLISAFTSASGKNLDGIFSSWLDGKVVLIH